MKHAVAKDKLRASLHELNSRVIVNPENRGDIIKQFYGEAIASGDQELADMVLLVRSITEAKGHRDMRKPFDHTKHLVASSPLLFAGLTFGFLVSVGCIAAGILALLHDAKAATELSIFGQRVSTGSVAVAIIFIGTICLFWIIKTVIKRTAPPEGL